MEEEELKEDIDEESVILEPGIVGPNRAIGYQDTLEEVRL